MTNQRVRALVDGPSPELGYLIVDVDRAVELYVAGWTLRRIAAELGVDHSTVAYRLHRAGVTLRRGGGRRHDVVTQHILDLRDQGMTMAATAAPMRAKMASIHAFSAEPASPRGSSSYDHGPPNTQ